MRKIEKLVLNQIAKKELTQRQQGLIRGGRGQNACLCGCCAQGGSSTDNNADANCKLGGYYSPCGTKMWEVCIVED